MNPQQVAQQAANRYFSTPQDRNYFMRQMGAEANFHDETSPAGAQGYAQIMPGTAAAWGVSNPHDPTQAYNAAAAHMASYLHQYGGSWAKALTAYNAGPGRVGKPLLPETQAYIAKILGGGSPTSAGGTTNVPAQPHTDVRGAIIDALLSSGSHVAGSIHQNLLSHAAALVNSGAYTTSAPDVQSITHAGMPPAPAGQLDHFDGKPVAGWIASELRWARAHGWSGTVTSGYRSDAQQKQIYDSGVRPAAVPQSEGGPGSNHEGLKFPLGAVDVSNAQQLASILSKKPGGSQLVYAGQKDPVHFSHPHGGGY